jgi:transcriptional regulator with XRE-family HTH domain
MLCDVNNPLSKAREMAAKYQEVVADNLERLRGDDARITQAQLAAKSGVAQKTISNIETTGTTTTGKIAAVAAGLGIQPFALFIPEISDIKTAKQLDRLITHFLESSAEGKEAIGRTAEAEARYSKALGNG